MGDPEFATVVAVVVLASTAGCQGLLGGSSCSGDGMSPRSFLTDDIEQGAEVSVTGQVIIPAKEGDERALAMGPDNDTVLLVDLKNEATGELDRLEKGDCVTVRGEYVELPDTVWMDNATIVETEE